MSKTDFASDELARNKLAKDLLKAYDYFVKLNPNDEFTPQLLINLLRQLLIFKELKTASEVQFNTEKNDNEEASNSLVKIQAEPDHPMEENDVSKNLPADILKSSRKNLEQDCLLEMWKVLSFGSREVTKDLIINVLHTMLGFEEQHTIFMRLQGVVNIPEDNLLKNMITKFSNLAKESKTTRHFHNFANGLKNAVNPQKEKEKKECYFVPEIDPKSRKIDGQTVRGQGSPPRQREGTFKPSQRSQSPQRNFILYDDYKEYKSKLQKKSEVLKEKATKELTFKPKVTKKAEKIKEDPGTRVIYCLSYY